MPVFSFAALHNQIGTTAAAKRDRRAALHAVAPAVMGVLVWMMATTFAVAQTLFPPGSLVATSVDDNVFDVFNPSTGAESQVAITLPGGWLLSSNFTFDPSRNVFVDAHNNDFSSQNILKISPTGTVTTFATGSAPGNLSADGAGNLYGLGGDGIDKFSPTGQASLFASSTSIPNLYSVFSDLAQQQRFLYVSANNNIYHLPTSYVDGQPLPAPIYTGVPGRFGNFTSIYPDANGDLFAIQTDPVHGDAKLVDEIDASGNLTTLATFNNNDTPHGIVVDANGNYFVQGENAIYENPTGAPKKSANPPFPTWTVPSEQLGGAYGDSSFAYAPSPTGGWWSGGGGNGDWSVTGNWSAAVPGVANNGATTTNTDVALFKLSVAQTSVTIDAVRSLQSITFDTTNVSPMTIGAAGGPALLLTSGGIIATTLAVTQSQTINAPLVLEGGGSYMFNSGGASGAILNFGGAITAGNSGTTTLVLYGTNTGNNTISGPIGAGVAGAHLGLSVQGATWILSAANTYSGPTVVSGGVLTIGTGTSGSLNPASAISVSGGTLAVAVGGSLGASNISVTGGTFAIIGGTVGNAAIAASGSGTVALLPAPGNTSLSIGSTGVGSAGASLSVASGATLSFLDGAAGVVHLQQQTGFAGPGLTLSGASLGLDFTGSAADQLIVSSAHALVSGVNSISLAVPSGATIVAGMYPLVSTPAGGLAGNYQFTGGGTTQTVNSGGNQYALTLSSSSKVLTLSVSSTQTLFPTGSLMAVNPFNHTLEVYPLGGGTANVVPLSFLIGRPGHGLNIGEVRSAAFSPTTGNLFVNDGNGTIWQITPTGGQTPFASVSANEGFGGLACDASGNLYATSDSFLSPSSTIYKFSQATGVRTVFATGLKAEEGVTGLTFANGNLYAATNASDVNGSAGGAVYRLPLNYKNVDPLPAPLYIGNSKPIELAVDSDGNTFATSQLSPEGVMQISPNGTASNFFSGNLEFSIAADTKNNIYATSIGGDQIFVFYGESSPATLFETVAPGTDGSGGGVSLAVVPALSAPAWTGEAGDGIWSNAGNWSGNVPGVAGAGTTANTDTAMFNGATTSNPLTIDAGGINVQNITFDTANVNSMTIGTTSGPPLLLTADGIIQTTSSVVTPQTINAPLVLEGDYTIISGATSAAATLTFGGRIAPAASISGTSTLTLTGDNAGANTISGVLADGSGSSKLAIFKDGVGTWILTAANSFTGGMTVYSGTLRFANTTGTNATVAGVATISNGATLELAGTSAGLSQSANVVNNSSGAAGTPAGLHVTGTNQLAGTVTGSGNTVVEPGASLTAYQIRQNSLVINGNGSVTLTPSGSGSSSHPANPNNVNFSSNVASLSIGGTPNNWTGTLDIGNNGLVIQYGGGTDPYSTIANMIHSGYANGQWTGTGITSSIARAAVLLGSPTPALNIGLIDFVPNGPGFSSSILFEGQTITTSAVLVRLTYMDDLVLSGDMAQSNATSDALFFAANYGSGTTWHVGDITHDGAIDTNDALLFAANYVVGLPSLDGTIGNAAALEAGTMAVPEPSPAILAALGSFGLGLLVRRRASPIVA